MNVIDAVLACAPAALTLGVIAFISGIVTAIFLIAIFKGAQGDENAQEALELAAPCPGDVDHDRSVEDALRVGIVRGFLEGTVSTTRDGRFEARRDEARAFALKYLAERRVILAKKPAIVSVENHA